MLHYFDMDPSLLQKAVVTLTAAQIQGMYGAPDILPAPAAAQVLVVDQIVVQTKPGGTQFTGGGAVTFQYHGTAVNPHGGNLPAATVISATATGNVLAPPSATYQPPAATGLGVTNAPQRSLPATARWSSRGSTPSSLCRNSWLPRRASHRGKLSVIWKRFGHLASGSRRRLSRNHWQTFGNHQD